jgi:hypothetical protein
LEGLTLALESPILVDLRSERTVTDLAEGLIYMVSPHVIGVKKPKYVGGNERGRDVDVDNGRGVNLAMIRGPVE